MKIVTASTSEPSAPTENLTIGADAHGSEDPEGLMDRSNKICKRIKYECKSKEGITNPLGAYPEGEVPTRKGTLLKVDAVYYGSVSSARRGECGREVSPEKEGMSFTKKPSRDYQSPTGTNSRIDIDVNNLNKVSKSILLTE
ncbi:hypothetical protein Taro_035089 [Colocasia esculenta]|uniref:Uncharacterized protein n=1 Tax=Colocasia esculenta TaxID=4460 RepID=A0A843VTC0_COLES|nr:hypothetical protein [Colocasia esculenta]